jgi:ATP-dependent DNA ligase
VGSAATNPLRAFTSYLWTSINDALICASCCRESSFKQTKNFSKHSPEASRNACKFGLDDLVSKRRDRSYEAGQS